MSFWARTGQRFATYPPWQGTPDTSERGVMFDSGNPSRRQRFQFRNSHVAERRDGLTPSAGGLCREPVFRRGWR
jgi:hypothetical protein